MSGLAARLIGKIRLWPPFERATRPRRAGRGKPTKRWTCIVQGQAKPFEVKAHTKSEARALAKARCGLKGRLPLGSVVLARQASL